jgi:Zn-dependent metalloprotease
MVYGDGDGEIFLDFTRASDVIAHELTHGVTQFTAALAYEGEAGGLNESMSDVFGSMFRQWRKGQSAAEADWQIGSDILGPGAKARGYTCLRDMANPAAAHCLAPQPTHLSQYRKGMDPHESSGIPNLAFYRAARALQGNTWEMAGRIWFQALAGSAPSPNMTMKVFANRTRTAASRLFSGRPAVRAAVDAAWKAVGLYRSRCGLEGSGSVVLRAAASESRHDNPAHGAHRRLGRVWHRSRAHPQPWPVRNDSAVQC